MNRVYVLSYTLPKYGGNYKNRLKSFKRRGIKFCIWYIYAKLKYKTVEVTKL